MQTARRCAVALILGTAIAAAAAAGADEVLDPGKGRIYRGEVLDERPHGEGTLTWPSGAAYSGQWANGARHGTGTYRDREGGVYVGEYRDGERSGRGRFTWPNERVYEGAWRASMRHGEGIVSEHGHRAVRPGGSSRRCTWRWGTLVPGSCSPARLGTPDVRIGATLHQPRQARWALRPGKGSE